MDDPAIINRLFDHVIDLPLPCGWDEASIQEYNEYLDQLEEYSGEQELPEDFTF